MTDPILYDFLDNAYNRVMETMPQTIKDADMASAGMLGAAGSYLSVRVLQFVSKMLPNFDQNVMPTLEKLCRVGIGFAPLIYAIYDPQGAREIMTEHPTYTAGMFGAWVGTLGALTQDIYKRKKNSLESLVE